MLVELAVANFALVERLRFRLHRGLNILTGETGAGKSLLLEALGVALGGRLEPEHLRQGAREAWVEARFDLEGSGLPRALLAEMGVPWPEDGELLLRRELLPRGKGRARVNDRAVTSGGLRRLGSWLVDLHGQHEHQWLLDPLRQRTYLDRFAGLMRERDEAREACAAYRRAREAWESHHRERARARADRDLFHAQAEELRGARLRAGEEEELAEERGRLVHAERLRELAEAAHAALYGGDGSAYDRCAEAERLLAEAVALDPTLASRREELLSPMRSLADSAEELRRYRDHRESDPERLAWVDVRLVEIRRLWRKYDVRSSGELLASLARLEGALEADENAAETRKSLRAEVTARGDAFLEVARRLSRGRRQAVPQLAQAVERELGDMAMPRARFLVSLESAPVLAEGDGGRLATSREATGEEAGTAGEDPLGMLEAEGGDGVEFLLAANVGEAPLPLRRVASGGEMSRVMLALKDILAGADEVDTLVFDEIDLGIGGETASVVGEKMKRIGGERQVVCITHLPQLAACGDHHFRVEKRISQGRTVIAVKELDGRERVEELARMMGGKTPSETAVRHAHELLAGSGGTRRGAKARLARA